MNQPPYAVVGQSFISIPLDAHNLDIVIFGDGKFSVCLDIQHNHKHMQVWTDFQNNNP